MVFHDDVYVLTSPERVGPVEDCEILALGARQDTREPGEN